ncbi:hypothetical protein DIPPA_09145 [Diplonema papillatum]|nr:hypothetical protein DIPPA_09145 [Diplonema papillatum]
MGGSDVGEASPAPPPAPRPRRPARCACVLLLLAPLLGGAVGFGFYTVVLAAERRWADREHEQLAAAAADALAGVAARLREDTTALAAVFGAAGGTAAAVTEASFRALAAYDTSDGAEPAAVLRAWLPRVPRGGRPVFEARGALEHPGFRFSEYNGTSFVRRRDSEVYYPLFFVTTETGQNEELILGFDLALTVNLTHVNIVAVDPLPAALQLSFGLGSDRLVLSAAPIVAPGTEAVSGFAVKMYRVESLISEVAGLHMDDINLYVVERGLLLYSSDPRVDEASKVPESSILRSSSFFAGSEWHLSVEAPDAFYAARTTHAPVAFAVLFAVFVSASCVLLAAAHAAGQRSKRKLQATMDVAGAAAAAIADMDLEQAAFLKELGERADPILFSLQQIVEIVVVYKRFLPDMALLREEPRRSEAPSDLNGDSEDSGSETSRRGRLVSRTSYNSSHSSGLPRVEAHLSLGLWSMRVTLLNLVVQCALQSSVINGVVCAIAACCRRHNFRIVCFQAAGAWIMATGTASIEVCKLWRGLTAQTPSARLHGGATFGKSITGVVGGKHHRHHMVTGDIVGKVEFLSSLSQQLDLTLLVHECVKQSTMGVEGFSFVDFAQPNDKCYELNPQSEVGNDTEAEWMYQIGDGPAPDPVEAACTLMLRKQWDLAREAFEKLPDDRKRSELVAYQLRKLAHKPARYEHVAIEIRGLAAAIPTPQQLHPLGLESWALLRCLTLRGSDGKPRSLYPSKPLSSRVQVVSNPSLPPDIDGAGPAAGGGSILPPLPPPLPHPQPQLVQGQVADALPPVPKSAGGGGGEASGGVALAGGGPLASSNYAVSRAPTSDAACQTFLTSGLAHQSSLQVPFRSTGFT